MAAVQTHRRTKSAAPRVFFVVVTLAMAGVISLFMANQAQGFGEVDASTIGIGASQSSVTATINPADRLGVKSSQVDPMAVSEVLNPTERAQRFITVKDPDPVLAAIAVDWLNPVAVEKGSQVCTLNPFPTAPRHQPDLNDGTWSRGVASAYNVSSNDDGRGNFGVSTTASGRPLSDSSVTVAVPASQAYLLGSVVEICYEGKIIIATVTDTGGFGKYGRQLDLGPGIYHALGFNSTSDWGTRKVYYRFL